MVVISLGSNESSPQSDSFKDETDPCSGATSAGVTRYPCETGSIVCSITPVKGAPGRLFLEGSIEKVVEISSVMDSDLPMIMPFAWCFVPADENFIFRQEEMLIFFEHILQGK